MPAALYSAYDIDYMDDGEQKREKIYGMTPSEVVQKLYQRRGPRIKILHVEYHAGSNLLFFLWKQQQEREGKEVDLPDWLKNINP